MARRRPEVTLVFSDVHTPKHDERAWRCFLDAIRKIRRSMKLVGLGCLGDLLELTTATRKERIVGDGDVTVLSEFRAGKERLAEASSAAGPGVYKFMIEGNHEFRYVRWLNEGGVPSEFKDAMPGDVQTGLDLKRTGWKYYDRSQQPVRIFCQWMHHGFWYGRHHGAKHADELGADNIYGHTHRPQQFTKTNLSGSFTSTGLGCLRKLERDWEHMKGRPYNGWTHGFGVVCRVSPTRTVAYNVLIEDGKAAWGGLEFSAD